MKEKKINEEEEKERNKRTERVASNDMAGVGERLRGKADVRGDRKYNPHESSDRKLRELAFVYVMSLLLRTRRMGGQGA